MPIRGFVMGASVACFNRAKDVVQIGAAAERRYLWDLPGKYRRSAAGSAGVLSPRALLLHINADGLLLTQCIGGGDGMTSRDQWPLQKGVALRNSDVVLIDAPGDTRVADRA